MQARNPQGQRLIEAFDRYLTAHPDEGEVVERFKAFVGSRPRCFENNHWDDGHITGSAWVVDTNGSHTLLTHHKKLQRWLQLGGHSDGDADTWRVARREAEEESGLGVEMIWPEIFDLDVHAIPARKNDPEHFHYDVRFAFRAQGRDFTVSEESHDLAWVDVADIGNYTDEWSVVRMAEKWLSRS